MRRHHTSTTAEVVSFSAGALVGAGLALLYAPKTGHEMREKVSDVTGDAIAKMKGMTAEAQEKFSQKMQRGREFAEGKAAEFSESKEELYH